MIADSRGSREIKADILELQAKGKEIGCFLLFSFSLLFLPLPFS